MPALPSSSALQKLLILAQTLPFALKILAVHEGVEVFAEDEGSGEVIVDGAFGGGDADESAIEDEIVVADDGGVGEEASGEEAQASAPEIYGSAGKVGEIETHKALAQSGAPTGTFESGEIDPAEQDKKGEGVVDECLAEEGEDF